MEVSVTRTGIYPFQYGKDEVSVEQQLMDVVMEMEMEDDGESETVDGIDPGGGKNPVGIKENGHMSDGFDARQLIDRGSEDSMVNGDGTVTGGGELPETGESSTENAGEMDPAPNSAELTFQGEHDGYKYYANSLTGICYSQDGSGFWYVQASDGHFRPCHAPDSDPAIGHAHASDNLEGFVPLDESGRPVYPLNNEGKPVLPVNAEGQKVFPMGRDEKPLFPWDAATGRPTFPVDDAGQPVFPIGNDGRPVVPVDANGMAVFPQGPDGSFIFPSKDGRPVAPVTVNGVPVVPLDESGKAIVPYDADGNAMIHVGADGVTPISDEEYAQQLQWHQYYEQYNQYAAQYYNQMQQPPPSQQQNQSAGYGSSNATYEGWQGIRATKKIRPEDIDLPVVPHNAYGEAPSGGQPMPLAALGSLAPPTMTEQQRLQDAKKKKLLEMQLKFSKKIELARNETGDSYSSPSGAPGVSGQVQSPGTAKPSQLNQYFTSLQTSVTSSMLQRFDPRLFDDENLSPPRRRRYSRSPRGGRRRYSRSPDRRRRRSRSQGRRRSPRRQERSERDRSKERDRDRDRRRSDRRRRSDDENRQEPAKNEAGTTRSRRTPTPPANANQPTANEPVVEPESEARRDGEIVDETRKEKDNGEKKKKKKRKKSKSRREKENTDGDGEKKGEEVTDLLALIERAEANKENNEDKEEGEIVDGQSPRVGMALQIGPQWQPSMMTTDEKTSEKKKKRKKEKMDEENVTGNASTTIVPAKKKQYHVAYVVETVTEPILQYTSHPDHAESFIVMKRNFDAGDGWKHAQKAFRHVEQALAILATQREPSPDDTCNWRQRHWATDGDENVEKMEEGSGEKAGGEVVGGEKWRPMGDGEKVEEVGDEEGDDSEKKTSKKQKKAKKHKKEKRKKKEDEEAELRQRLEEAERRRLDEERQRVKHEEEMKKKEEEEMKRQEEARRMEEAKKEEERKQLEEKKKREEERKKLEEEQRKKEEQARKRKEEAERKRQDEERKRREEEERVRAEKADAEKRKQEEAELRQRVIAEQKRRLDEQRRLEEEQRAAMEEKKRLEREASEKEKRRIEEEKQRRESEEKKAEKERRESEERKKLEEKKRQDEERRKLDAKTVKKDSPGGAQPDDGEDIEQRVREMERRIAARKATAASPASGDRSRRDNLGDESGSADVSGTVLSRLDETDASMEEELKMLRMEAMSSRAERILAEVRRERRQLKREQRKQRRRRSSPRKKRRRRASSDSEESSSETSSDEEDEDDDEDEAKPAKHRRSGGKHKKKKRKRSSRKAHRKRSESSESDAASTEHTESRKAGTEAKETTATESQQGEVEGDLFMWTTRPLLRKEGKRPGNLQVLREKIGEGNPNAHRLLDELRTVISVTGSKKQAGTTIHVNPQMAGARPE